MSNHLRLFFTFMMLCLCIGVKAQYNVSVKAIVTMTNGSESEYSLSDKDLISFEGEDYLVIQSENTIRIPLADIRKIVFVDTLDTDETASETPYLYPNPVKDAFLLGNIGTNQMMRIYSIDGRLVEQSIVSGNQRISVNSLSAGAYIISVNGYNFKMMKL